MLLYLTSLTFKTIRNGGNLITLNVYTFIKIYYYENKN